MVDFSSQGSQKDTKVYKTHAHDEFYKEHSGVLQREETGTNWSHLCSEVIFCSETRGMTDLFVD